MDMIAWRFTTVAAPAAGELVTAPVHRVLRGCAWLSQSGGRGLRQATVGEHVAHQP
jgi:hypothetical protein